MSTRKSTYLSEDGTYFLREAGALIISVRVSDLGRLFLAAFCFMSRLVLSLIHTADGSPGIDPERRGEFLELEPGAGLIGAYLKGYAFAQDVDW